MDIIIIGGGIIGASTAFYLTELKGLDPSCIHIIDSSPELVASASGYAGGFLAKDWFSPPSASLGAVSFDLHAELASKYNGRKIWGYSKTTSYSLANSKTSKRGEDWLVSGSRASVGKVIYENKLDSEPSWLKRIDGDGLDMIGKDTSAQVDPRRLTLFLLETAIGRGVQLHHPFTPTRLNLSRQGMPESIEIAPSLGKSVEKQILPCYKLILAAGAWTPSVYQTLFPDSRLKIPISPLAGHSLLLRTDKWKDTDTDNDTDDIHKSATGGGCHAVYSSTYTAGIGEWSPEIYSRVGGEIYIAGLNDQHLPLPRLATDRVLQPEKLKIVLEEARRLVGVDQISELEVIRQGLCFRPVTNRGMPIIGEIQKNVYIAAGHGPWGISMSLGTGKVLAELILGKALSADISRLGI